MKISTKGRYSLLVMIDLTENKAKNDASTDTGYLKNITYSNLADKKVQNEVQEILKNSGVNPSNINLFFKSVNYYNEATQNKGLIKEGFVNSENINPTYDEVAIQQIWDKKNKNLENFKASVKYDIVMKKAIDEVVKNSKNA